MAIAAASMTDDFIVVRIWIPSSLNRGGTRPGPTQAAWRSPRREKHRFAKSPPRKVTSEFIAGRPGHGKLDTRHYATRAYGLPPMSERKYAMGMEVDERTQVTTLLGRIRGGDDDANDQLLALVCNQLRDQAHGIYAPHHFRNTLQPTALVHEAWIKLAGHLDSLECRRHFFAVATKAMRQVLANMVRDSLRDKRGGDMATIQLNEPVAARDSKYADIDLDALDRALSKLSELNARHAQVVEFRMLGTMTVQEIADELELPKRTVERDWLFARQWLHSELSLCE
jgi:RNA polymerase sigma factor (TIGR02999 family)